MEDGTLKVSDFGLARKLYQELYHKNVTSKVSTSSPILGRQPKAFSPCNAAVSQVH